MESVEKNVQHIVSECEKLAQKEYKRRHDNVAKKINWDFCKIHEIAHHKKLYDRVVTDTVVENDSVNFSGT